MNLSVLVVFLSTAPVVPTSPHFTAFGDWGATYGQLNVVSRRLLSQAESLGKTKFTLLLGDNFYPAGVTSVDDKQFELFSWFSDSSDKFYVIAGNHDYETPGSVEHEIAYSEVNSKWIFPKIYYSRIEKIAGYSKLKVCLVFVDSMTFADDSVQQAWLDAELKKCSHLPNTLKIVSGHFPVYSSGMYANSKTIGRFREAINPILKQHQVHMYLAGHEHQMQVFVADGIHYLIIGSIVEIYPEMKDKFGEYRKFHSLDIGFANFHIDIDRAIVTYNLVRAIDNAIVHTSSVDFRTEPIEKPITVTTTTTTTLAPVQPVKEIPVKAETIPKTTTTRTPTGVNQDIVKPITKDKPIIKTPVKIPTGTLGQPKSDVVGTVNPPTEIEPVKPEVVTTTTTKSATMIFICYYSLVYLALIGTYQLV